MIFTRVNLITFHNLLYYVLFYTRIEIVLMRIKNSLKNEKLNCKRANYKYIYDIYRLKLCL